MTYYQEHKEKCLSYHKEYYKKNKKRLAEKAKRRYQDNREALIESGMRYYWKNRTAILEKTKERDRIYYENNRELVANNNRKYYLKNKDRILSYNEKNRYKYHQAAVEKNRVGRKDLSDWYVKHRLKRTVGVDCKLATSKLIQIKREQIMVWRLYKKARAHISEKTGISPGTLSNKLCKGELL